MPTPTTERSNLLRWTLRAFRGLWMLYQIALGAVLLLLLMFFLQFWTYLHVGDIRALRKHPPKTTAFIEAERSARPDVPIRRTWIPLDSIPKTLQRLVLVAEDAKFYTHQGFDLEQIEYALVANHQSGRRMRGASTITQQTAKNLYLGGEREMSRKLREAAISLVLEQTLSKDRILEVYLNIAQFGPGVFGVREGARHHFGKDVTALTREEMLALVCVLPSPVKWNPKRPTGPYLAHKARVSRNYGILGGLLEVQAGGSGDSEALDSLGNLLTEQDWRRLRTGPYGEAAGDDSSATVGDAGAEDTVSVPASRGAEGWMSP